MRYSTFRKRNSTGASRPDVLCTMSFYGLAVVAAVFVAARFRDEGMGWVLSLLLGAGAGAVGVWFLSWFFWQATMRITRGAPFRIGDRVEITNGEHKGAVGNVQEVLEGRYAVRVMLENQADTESSLVFSWNELRRLPVK